MMVPDVYKRQELLMYLERVKIQGTYRKMMKQLGKINLLIIDEFLLSLVNETEVNSILVNSSL